MSVAEKKKQCLGVAYVANVAAAESDFKRNLMSARNGRAKAWRYVGASRRISISDIYNVKLQLYSFHPYVKTQNAM